MQVDEYGWSTICNIYFDTPSYDMIRRSLDKPLYKEKLRLRSYGIPHEESIVFLELKKKYEGIVYKRRESLLYETAERFLYDGVYPARDTQIMRELAYTRQFYDARPALFLGYDRVALFGREDPLLRLTFDARIRYRTDRLHLHMGDEGELLMPEGDYIMELKVPLALPMWMVQLLNRFSLLPTSFSKYGEIYRHKLLPILQKKEETDHDLQHL